MERDNPPTDELFAPGLRGRPVLVGLVVVLAASTAGSIWAAVHFHQQAARLSRPASREVVDQPRFVRSAPASVSAPPASAVVAGSGTDSPSLSSHSYELDTGAAHTTVYLVVASSQGGTSTTGYLLVTALIRGATKGAHYRLIGGDCDPTSAGDVVWAEGSGDASGTAYLSGAARILPKADQYFMTIDPWQPPTGADPRLVPGLEGEFVLGEADPFVGHVNRISAVGGGECFVGP